MGAEPIWTEAEAATYLRMGERTLRELRRRGQIRYIALTARKIAYRPEDCEEYLSARVRVEPTCDTKPKPKRRSAGRRGNVVALADYMD